MDDIHMKLISHELCYLIEVILTVTCNYRARHRENKKYVLTIQIRVYRRILLH